jgi:hypothetical protein
MRVPDGVRKTVGFIGYEDKRNGEFIPVGSFFFLGHDPKAGEPVSEKVYLVTARHLIDKLRDKAADDAVLRLNRKDPNAPLIRIAVPLTKWFSHPHDESIDVAITKVVTELGLPPTHDHLTVPINRCATEAVLNEIYLGEEVFISGLFRYHPGTRRNIPIVRIGNLAALNEERIVSISWGKEIEGYLIEARSIGGLSGSRVFLNHEGAPLVGLIHGHYDDQKAAAQNGTTKAINAGIAIVVPVKNILTVISAFENNQQNAI